MNIEELKVFRRAGCRKGQKTKLPLKSRHGMKKKQREMAKSKRGRERGREGDK